MYVRQRGQPKDPVGSEGPWTIAAQVLEIDVTTSGFMPAPAVSPFFASKMRTLRFRLEVLVSRDEDDAMVFGDADVAAVGTAWLARLKHLERLELRGPWLVSGTSKTF
jgi:hypothetical protein